MTDVSESSSLKLQSTDVVLTETTSEGCVKYGLVVVESEKCQELPDEPEGGCEYFMIGCCTIHFGAGREARVSAVSLFVFPFLFSQR